MATRNGSARFGEPFPHHFCLTSFVLHLIINASKRFTSASVRTRKTLAFTLSGFIVFTLSGFQKLSHRRVSLVFTLSHLIVFTVGSRLKGRVVWPLCDSLYLSLSQTLDYVKSNPTTSLSIFCISGFRIF